MTAACPACTALPEPRDIATAATPNVTLSVPGLRCAACIGTVERALAAVPGVAHPRVNLTLKRVSMTADVPVARLVDALKHAGYDAFALDQATLGGQADPKGRDLVLRLGVAGFAMMNVMLLSVAVWSGAADATRDLFHLISAAIAVPVVGYAGQPFFQSAWAALRVRSLNMDVPISLAILLATAMSVYESLNGGAHAYFDAGLSLTFFLLIGRYLDHRTRASARSAARELAALEVQTASRLDGKGRAQEVDLTALAVGDRVLVPTGMRVPVDGVLDAETAVTDRSFLSGESEPVTSNAGDKISAGEINLGGPFVISATAVGEDTSLRRIARMVEQAEGARNRYTGLADRAARIYAPAVHLLALAAFLGWVVWSGDVRFALNVAIAVLIITCPCALGLAVPAVSTAAIGKLYDLGFLVKSGTALERLAEVDAVVFDKTGTLTEPGLQMGLEQLTEDQASVALGLAQASTHPVSRALAVALDGRTPAKLQEVTDVAGLGVRAVRDGEPVALGRGESGLELRVGETVLPLTKSERLRDGAQDAVDGLRDLGLDLSLISGDVAGPVDRVARDLGVATALAGQSPDDKHRWITGRDGAVAMIGDGLNDTAALAAAHASVAPSSALDASRNAADVVVIRESLGALPQLFAIARKSSALSRQNFAIAAAYNAVAIPVALAGMATPLLAALAMSVSSLTVLVNALRVRQVR